MVNFYQKVDLRNRNSMIHYLSSHFRYYTMNSWNRSTSYANNVKIYNLGLEKNEEDKLYELIEMSEFYDRINRLFFEFDRRHNFLWQAGFNGRNCGYIVLYQGYSKQSNYKSYCTLCGQRNYKSVDESGNCICGRCGKETRVDYDVPPIEYGIYPGRGTDIYNDFEEWDIFSLRERVKLVQDFDRFCDDVLSEVRNIIKNYDVETDIVYVPQRIKKLREASKYAIIKHS